MASVTMLDKMNIASSWPTDYALFEAAKAKAPEYAKQLDYLMEDTEQAMREKDLLDHRVGQVLDLEVMIAHDWPTNISLFRMAIDKLNAHQDYEISEELDDRWDVVNERMAAKRNLDASILQILNGTFTGDPENAYSNSETLATCHSPSAPVLAGHVTPPASPGFMEPPPIQRLPRVVSATLSDSGAFEHDYEKHGFFTESDVGDMREEREQREQSENANQSSRRYSFHDVQRTLDLTQSKELESQCWAQVTEQDEARHSILLSNGISFSPLTLAIPPQRVMSYIDEVDSWARDVERLIAESKAIREAPLSSFADLASYEDDDTIPEVDIEST